MRRKRHREPTSDASTTNSRRQDCDESGQASCRLYDLQSVPNKFHSKSCGTSSLLKEYPVRRGSAASLYQALVLLVFPGCPTAACHRNAKTQVPPWPGYCPCAQGQALLRQGRAGHQRQEGAALKRGRPHCFPASAQEGGGPTAPSGTSDTTPLVTGPLLATGDWLARTDASVGLVGHTQAPLRGPEPLGLRVPGPSHRIPAGAARSSSPVSPPHPHRGDLSQTSARRRVGAAVTPRPGQAPSPGTSQQGHAPSPAGPGSRGQARPSPHELQKRLVPTSPTKVCTGAPDPQNLLHMLLRGLGSGESPPVTPTASGL